MSHFNKTYKEVTNESLIPKETDTYKPMPNKYLIDSLTNRIQDEGFNINGRNFAMNRAGDSLFAVLSVESEISGYSTMIGAVNSYDKSRAVGVATGARVHLCNNLSFSNFKKLRRHTKNLFRDYDNILNQMVNSLKTDAVEVIEQNEELENIPLEDSAIPHLLGEMFYQEELINTTQLNLIKKNMKNGDYVFGKDNFFDFMMHCTEAMKKSHPRTIVQDHMAVENWVHQKAEEVATSQPVSLN